jgi:uncharacterized protein YehS (DUF1456 family)
VILLATARNIMLQKLEVEVSYKIQNLSTILHIDGFGIFLRSLLLDLKELFSH